MALILNIETATPVLSVSLARDGHVLDLLEMNTKNRHAERLTLFIDEVLKKNSVSFDELAAVAVSEGPGSYTGLRIGVSTAKGICYSRDIPLIAVSTLKSMALSMTNQWIDESDKKNLLFCPMIDARRMEVYSALYDYQNKEIRKVQADIVDENSYRDYLEKNKIIFGGDGADKCKKVIQDENAVFLDEVYPSAATMAIISEEYFKNGKFADVAYFEPFYLKTFIAGKAKVKGLYD